MSPIVLILVVIVMLSLLGGGRTFTRHATRAMMHLRYSPSRQPALTG